MDKQSKENKKNHWTNTWLWKNLINNKFVSILLVIFLLSLNIYMLTRISYVFEPLVIIFNIVGPPLLFSVIFYYLLSPVIDWLEKTKFTRSTAIAFVFSLILLLIIGGMYFIVPIVQEQVETFIESFPSYWNNFMIQLDTLLNTQAFTDFMEQLSETTILATLSNQTSSVIDATVGSIGSLIGTVTRIFITLFTVPFVLYYLLKDGKRLPEFVYSYIPTSIRPQTRRLLFDINRQVSFYVRGELIVAVSVGIIFWIGFSIAGLDFALIIGIFAGFLNLIPYLGSIIAVIPALIIAVVHSPFMLFKVLIVIGIEQILENRIISPQVLGNRLKIHPIVIIFILLIAGRLFGLFGLIFGIPGYAIIKIIVSRVFNWYRKYSGLYETEDPAPNPSEALIEMEDE